MPMLQVHRDRPTTKREFHQLLRAWLSSTSDGVVGAEEVDGRTPWIHVRDGTSTFVLHADTRREAVERYVQLVTLHGDELHWEIAPSQRGNMTAVVYGPEQV